jgi:hypothetical protein
MVTAPQSSEVIVQGAVPVNPMPACTTSAKPTDKPFPGVLLVSTFRWLCAPGYAPGSAAAPASDPKILNTMVFATVVDTSGFVGETLAPVLNADTMSGTSSDPRYDTAIAE